MRLILRCMYTPSGSGYDGGNVRGKKRDNRWFFFSKVESEEESSLPNSSQIDH